MKTKKSLVLFFILLPLCSNSLQAATCLEKYEGALHYYKVRSCKMLGGLFCIAGASMVFGKSLFGNPEQGSGINEAVSQAAFALGPAIGYLGNGYQYQLRAMYSLLRSSQEIALDPDMSPSFNFNYFYNQLVQQSCVSNQNSDQGFEQKKRMMKAVANIINEAEKNGEFCIPLHSQNRLMPENDQSGDLNWYYAFHTEFKSVEDVVSGFCSGQLPAKYFEFGLVY